MRTKKEHILRKLKRLGWQIGRLARAAVRHVRSVLKRVRGGGLVDRQRGEVEIFASPATACVNTGEAACGLPNGKPFDDARAWPGGMPGAGHRRGAFFQYPSIAGRVTVHAIKPVQTAAGSHPLLSADTARRA